MKLIRPAYFEEFRCIAAACPDSCCKEWDVAVDDMSAAYYRSMEGDLGDRLRQVLYDEDGNTYMAIEDGRCPMWQHDGLCRIQKEWGHDALCKTCREFPRLTHDYGDFVEQGLELSCPEAARIILSGGDAEPIAREMDGGEPPEYDTEAMQVLLRTREEARKLLKREDLPPSRRLACLLLYGYQAQAELDGDASEEVDAAHMLEQGKELAEKGDEALLRQFFRELEILTEQWKCRLEGTWEPAAWQEIHIRIARYFVDRYWLQAVCDYDLVGRVKLAVVSCILLRLMGGDPVQTAQLYSKEIENSADNVDALLDGAYSAPALTDRRLLGWLLLGE